tara:strand:- start:1511 stop:1789 length:279 start_codon:yes stop_codon:yes gene_type:complete
VISLVKVEGTLEELKALFVESAKQEARQTAKRAGKTAVKKVVKTAKRAPSAYNKYMKRELARLKKAHPRMTHQARFKKAAKGWKRSKKGGKK